MSYGYELKPELGNPSRQWWTGEGDSYVTFQTIKQQDGSRLNDYKHFVRLYANRDLIGFGPISYATDRSREKVTLNIVKSVVDTVSSRIAKSHPRPRFLTNGGNYSTQKRARLLERWVDAQFYLTRTYKLAPAAFRDSAAFGTGVVKVWSEGTDVCVERIFPGELFVDRVEGLYGAPRQMHQRKFIDRGVLLRKFPACAEEIAKLPTNSSEDGELSGADTTADQIEVVESWHLSSGKGAKDGRHCIKAQSVTLLDEKYTKDYFPFVFLHWSEPIRGFWGQGLIEELVGIQVEINHLLQKIQKAMYLVANPQWWVEQSSKVKQGQISNIPGQINRYVGTPPTVYTPAVMPPEVYMHLERLIARAYEIAGVSRLSAGSQKPPELESGKALREYHDIETERFALVSRAWEEFFMEIARQMVECGRDIYARNKDYKIVAQRDRMSIEEVRWEDVDLDADAYVLQVFPSSSLPSTPAGRLATVVDMMGNGLVDMPTAKRLLDFPDLEEELALDRAARDNIARILEQIIDEEQYESPEPFQDHQLALKMFQAKYQSLLGKEDIEDSVLDMLRQYMVATNDLMMKAQQQAMAQAGGAQSPLPGAPPAPDGSGQAPMAVTPQDGTIA